MPHQSFFSKLFVCALALISVSGCISPVEMAVSPELESNSSVMRAVGRSAFNYDKPFTFGEYQVRDIKKDWTKGTGLNLSINNYNLEGPYRQNTHYEFTFDPNTTESWQSECVFGKRGFSLGIDKGNSSTTFSSSKTSLNCSFRSNEKKREGELRLAETNDLLSYLVGDVTIDGKTLEIKGTGKIKRTKIRLGSHSGFEFYHNDLLVASVETIHEGAVWVHNSVEYDTRTQIILVSSALLLYSSLGAVQAD